VKEQVERRLETLLRAILGIPIDDAEYAALTESQERTQRQPPTPTPTPQQQQPTTADAATSNESTTTETPATGAAVAPATAVVVAAPVTIPEPSPEAIQQLVDIGFSENRARKALILNGYASRPCDAAAVNTYRLTCNRIESSCSNGSEEALLWLCEHSEDPDIDDPLTPEQLQQLALANAPPVAAGASGVAGGAATNAAAAAAAPARSEQDELVCNRESISIANSMLICWANRITRGSIDCRMCRLEHRSWRWASQRNSSQRPFKLPTTTTMQLWPSCLEIATYVLQPRAPHYIQYRLISIVCLIIGLGRYLEL